MGEKPDVKPRSGIPEVAAKYIAPRRTHIKDEVGKLLPFVPRELVRKLDYWALYTIHQDIVKSGADPESMARRLVRGYDPAKIRAAQKREEERKQREEERKHREAERAMRAKEALHKKIEAQRKKEEARAKAAAAKARERAAREATRTKAKAV